MSLFFTRHVGHKTLRRWVKDRSSHSAIDGLWVVRGLVEAGFALRHEVFCVHVEGHQNHLMELNKESQ